MTITILALGSRGDVQPSVALGLGLQASGYEVRIVTHAIFETFIRNSGLGFSLVEANPKEVLESEAGQEALQGGNPLRAARNFAHLLNPLIRQTAHDCWAACQDSDAILYSPTGSYFGSHIAEKLKVPAIDAYYLPMHPTRAFPSVFFIATQRNWGGIFNQLTHVIADSTFWLPQRSAINEWRQEQLNLPPVGVNYLIQQRKRSMPVIYGFSPSVVPRPPDWHGNIEITGYWFLDAPAGWKPSTNLLEFLEAGPPPVYFGFGSINPSNPEETADLILQALTQTKQRGLLSTGWGGLSLRDLSDNVFVIEESLPHDWLFPQMTAVVHHGGAGTTAAGLRAGVPSIVVFSYLDQPFWGQRVADLGVGPRPIPRKQLTVERLAAAIRTAVNDKEMQRRAAMLGKRIRAEDGVARAVEVINRYLQFANTSAGMIETG